MLVGGKTCSGILVFMCSGEEDKLKRIGSILENVFRCSGVHVFLYGDLRKYS